MTLNQRIWRVLKPTLFAVVVFYLLIGVYKARVPFGLTWNTTPSIPLGVYASMVYNGSALQHGDLVCVRYSEPEWAKGRDYLPVGVRLCKPVAAIAGDTIEREGQTLTIRRKDGAVKVLHLLDVDSKGRPMPTDVLSSSQLQAGQVLLISDYLPNSFDSRYLGVFTQSQLTHRIWPLIAPK